MTHICDVVLPCRDEAPALRQLLRCSPDGMRVIVVDNASTDETARVAADLGADVVFEPASGYGAAVHAGVLASTAYLVAVMDGDGSLGFDDLYPLVDDVRRGRADLALGRRRPVDRRAWPWHARWGNQAVSAWLRYRTGLAVHDIAPMRVCRRLDLLELDVRDRRFGYPVELLVKARQAGWTISERDVRYAHRASGTVSKVSGSLTGTIRAARDFARALP